MPVMLGDGVPNPGVLANPPSSEEAAKSATRASAPNTMMMRGENRWVRISAGSIASGSAAFIGRSYPERSTVRQISM
jgi:hypothetical protein